MQPSRRRQCSAPRHRTGERRRVGEDNPLAAGRMCESKLARVQVQPRRRARALPAPQQGAECAAQCGVITSGWCVQAVAYDGAAERQQV